MTYAIIVLLVLAVFAYVIKKVEDRVGRVSKRQHHTEDRISGLEIKDYSQDVRLDEQQRTIKIIINDVNELGKDVGWGDDKRATQEIKKPDDGDT